MSSTKITTKILLSQKTPFHSAFNKKQNKTLFMHTCVFVGTQNIKQRCRLLKCQNLTQITHSEYVYKQRLQRPQLRLRNSACETINTFCLSDCQTNDSKAWQQIDCVPSHFSTFFRQMYCSHQLILDSICHIRMLHIIHYTILKLKFLQVLNGFYKFMHLK